MYTKEPRWSQTPADVVQVVGTSDLPSRPLVEYALTTPGVATAIIGIGRIDSDGRSCQLEQNLSAAQVRAESFGRSDREGIERLALRAREGRTNWFQVAAQPLGAPRDAAATVETRGGKRVVRLSWHTAYAADEPIVSYEIRRDGRPLGKVEHRPQTGKVPFRFEDAKLERDRHTYEVVTIDRAGRTAASPSLEAGA
jgi:hypothetical protein